MLAARAPCYAIGIVITFYLYYALSLPALFGFKNRDEHDRIADVKNATLGVRLSRRYVLLTTTDPKLSSSRKSMSLAFLEGLINEIR